MPDKLVKLSLSQGLVTALLVVITLGSGISTLQAQTVSKATGGGSITADYYNISNFDSLSGPTIRETSAGQLVEGETIVLKTPDGFIWNTNNTVTDSVEPAGANLTHLDVSSPTVTDSTITVTILSESRSAGQGQGPGELTFYGIEVQPDDPIIPNSGNITNTGTTGPGGNTNYGDLKMIPGERTTIYIETKNDGTGNELPDQNITAGNSVTVYSISRDQFDNFIQNINVGESGWSLVNISGGVAQDDLTPANSAREATFSSNLTGSAQIEASLGEGNANLSGTLTVIPDETDHLAITRQPSSQTTAGQVFSTQPILELRDQFDNKVTDNDSRTVTASATDSKVELKGTTSVTPTNGVISYSDLNIEKAETTTLTFESGGLSSVESNGISISPDTASDLTYQVQPSNTVVGEMVSPAVELQLMDQFGNEVPVADSTVTVSQVESGALSNTSYSSSTDTNGIATFSNIQIDENAETDKNIQLEAVIDQVNMSAVISNEFKIISATALAEFTITDTSGSALDTVSAGQSFDTKIKSLDGNGDLYDSYQDSVVISSSNGTLTEGGGGTQKFTNGVLSSHPITITSAGDISLTATHPSDNTITGETTVPVIPADVFDDSTEVAPNPASLTADGTSTSTITIQLKDEFGNNLQSGGENISIETTAGTLDNGSNTGDSLAVIDNADGTYTIDLQSSTKTDTAQLNVYRDQSLIHESQTIAFTAGSLDDFIIRAPDSTNISLQTAGVSFEVDVWAVDGNDNRISNFSASLIFSSDVGGLASGDSASMSGGHLSNHSLTIEEADSNASVSVTDESEVTGTSNSFVIDAAPPDLSTSTVSTSPYLILNDGNTTSEINVILQDAFQNRVYEDRLSDLSLDTTRKINVDNGGTPTLAGLSFNQTQGVYIDTITSSSTLEKVIFEARLNNNPISDTDSVEIVLPNRWTSKSSGPGDPDDWNDPDNWSLGAIPTSSDFVIIPSDPADGSDFPVIDENINIGSFTIENGGNVQVSQSQTFEVQNDATIDGAWDINTASDVFIYGSLKGNGSFIADGDHLTEVKGDVSVASYISATTGAILRLNGSQPQTLSSADISIHDLRILNDVSGETDIVTTKLDIDGDNTFNFPSGGQDTLEVVDITGSGRLDLNDNRMLLRGNIDVQDLGTRDAKINFIDTTRQTIGNFREVGELVVDNPADVRVFSTNNMTVHNELVLRQGFLELPSGVNLIANSKTRSGGGIRALRNIPTPKGWRIVSSPIVSSFDRFLDGTVTQGYTGATLSDTLQPNVLWFKEDTAGTDNQHWRAPDDAGNNLEAGRGYFVFFFGDVANDSRYSDPLPDTLSIQGTQGAEFDGNSTFEFPVTYTYDADTTDTAGTGWNMIGNPFAATIDWDDDANWTKSNVDNVIYVWSPTDSTYKNWNGSSGSLDNGLLAPFQGFWVKASDSVATLSADASAKTTGGVFKNKREQRQRSPGFKLQLVQRDTAELNFSFTENGRRSKDRYDAYQLEPMNGTRRPVIYSTLPDGNRISINNLPLRFGKPITVPVGISSTNGGSLKGNFQLQWSQIDRLPEGWSLSIEDRETKSKISLEKSPNYAFTVGQNKQASSDTHNDKQTGPSQTIQHGLFDGPPLVKSKQKRRQSRFLLHIDPGATNNDIPNQFTLSENYPNPFNPETTIPYGVPIESHIRIDVYNILGRHVTTLINRRQNAGHHEISHDFSGLASGVYIYRLRTEGKHLTRKMMLIK